MKRMRPLPGNSQGAAAHLIRVHLYQITVTAFNPYPDPLLHAQTRIIPGSLSKNTAKYSSM